MAKRLHVFRTCKENGIIFIDEEGMKYRKKPVVIEAIQWDGTYEQVSEIKEFAPDVYERTDLDFKRRYLYIKTLEGDFLVSPKDYIIKGIKGEFYSCKPDIFEATYEPVTPPQEKDDA